MPKRVWMTNGAFENQAFPHELVAKLAWGTVLARSEPNLVSALNRVRRGCSLNEGGGWEALLANLDAIAGDERDRWLPAERTELLLSVANDAVAIAESRGVVGAAITAKTLIENPNQPPMRTT